MTQVARCTKIIEPNTDNAKYVINVKQIAKFVVGLGDRVSPTDIEEGMRVGCVCGTLPPLPSALIASACLCEALGRRRGVHAAVGRQDGGWDAASVGNTVQ